ncbi:phosphatidate cytidylyltransferase [Candidatus Zixiibacteriota bacterium]
MADSDLKIRTLVALAGIPILLGAVVLGDLVFLFVVLVITLRAVWEIPHIFTGKEGALPVRVVGSLGAIALLADAWWNGGGSWALILLGGAMLILLIELFRTADPDPSRVAGGTLAAWLWVTIPLAHLLWLREAPGIAGSPAGSGAWLVISLWIMIWISDSAAYFIGRSLGKKKLYEAVSPNKTWAGTIAGLVAGAITGGVLAAVVPRLLWDIPFGLLLGFLIGITAALGDLVESRLKRGAGLKDVGEILPGHGGFLDRFDSTLFSAPFLYYVLIVRGLL